MDIQKIIKRVETVKTELASIRKEVDAEDKRIRKLQKKTDATRAKLEAKLQNLDIPNDGVVNAKIEQQAAKLRGQIEQIYRYDDVWIGEASDYPDDSLLGALATAQQGLDELVTGKGKKIIGRLIDYKVALAAAEDMTEE